jgi:hypothetical protein
MSKSTSCHFKNIEERKNEWKKENRFKHLAYFLHYSCQIEPKHGHGRWCCWRDRHTVHRKLEGLKSQCWNWKRRLPSQMLNFARAGCLPFHSSQEALFFLLCPVLIKDLRQLWITKITMVLVLIHAAFVNGWGHYNNLQYSVYHHYLDSLCKMWQCAWCSFKTFSESLA